MYPGSACQPFFGSDAADFFTEPDPIVNVGAANRFVTCPIVRDNHANLDGVKSVGVRVRSDGVNPLTCDLDSFSALGDFVESNTNSTTSNAVTNLALDINTSTKGGTYSLFCNLPPGGSVWGYRVDEF